MKTTKKLVAIMLITVLAVSAAVSSTYAWYSHSKLANGTRMNLSEADLPVSLKTENNCVSYETYISNERGEKTDIAASSINVTPAEKVKYYKTTFTNSGNNDVMVDMAALNLPNDANFYIGTVSPTINEKAYASRAVRNKVSDDTVRVYFKTHSIHSKYWGSYTNAFNPNNQVGSSNGTTNDFNLAYTVGTTETLVQMNQCKKIVNNVETTNVDSTNDGTGRSDVYYYDVPANATSFYFFNHWYLCSATDRNWNRTTDITDLTAGRLYYLNGGSVDGQWKDYTVRDVDTDLVAVNQYYKSLRTSYGTGVFSDVTLHKTGDDENFIPEYYGETISYSSSNPNVAQVNRDGIITPVSSGTATITTTITGKYGDTRQVKTSLDIPAVISQVSIIKNLRVPAGESIAVDWYALNNDPSTTMETPDGYNGGYIFTT